MLKCWSQRCLQGPHLHHKEHISHREICDFCVIKQRFVVQGVGVCYSDSDVKRKALYLLQSQDTAISDLAFLNLLCSKCKIKQCDSSEFLTLSAREHRVKYCFCAVLHAIWEISWLSCNSILDGHSQKCRERKCGWRKVYHVVAKAQSSLWVPVVIHKNAFFSMPRVESGAWCCIGNSC